MVVIFIRRDAVETALLFLDIPPRYKLVSWWPTPETLLPLEELLRQSRRIPAMVPDPDALLHPCSSDEIDWNGSIYERLHVPLVESDRVPFIVLLRVRPGYLSGYAPIIFNHRSGRDCSWTYCSQEAGHCLFCHRFSSADGSAICYLNETS